MNIHRKGKYKILTKTKDFAIIDSEILLMKTEMSRFAPVSPFALGYPSDWIVSKQLDATVNQSFLYYSINSS